MKKSTLLLTALIFVLSITQTSRLAGQTPIEKAQNSIQSKGEVYFIFNITSKEEIKFLTKIISIDNVKEDVVYAYASPKQFEKFLSLGYDFEVISKLTPSKELTMATTVAEMANWDRYPTYSVYLQMMQLFAQNYPSLCRLDTIGTSQNGRLVLVIKITDNPDADEDEPEFFYSSTMHGNEIAGYVILLRLIDYLLSNYETNPQVTNLVNNIEIWINPLANPDGTYFGGNNTVAGAIRYLANWVDANRNFPDPEDGDHPDGNPWAPETIDMMNFADEHNFVMSANIHSGAEVANYPWDTWPCNTHPHADKNWWEYVCAQYADTVFDNSPSGYFTDVSSNGYICGYDWYEVDGGRQDYMTYFNHCREFTLEISNDGLLDAELLPAHWGYNYKSLLNYMKQSLYGIRGIITDSCTGQPIQAKVEIIGHDYDNSFVYSTLPVGNYHRPIYAGTYDVTFSAPGYQSKTIQNISVSNENTTILNVQLSPIAPVADFTYSIDNFTVHFINQSTGAESYFWDFGDGNTDTSANPAHTYNNSGIYDVMLIATNSCGTDTILVSIPIGIIGITENYPDIKDIDVFPNPTDGIVSIKHQTSNIKRIEILDLYGERILKSEILPMAIGTKSEIKIDLSDYAKGLYFVQIITEKQVFIEKIVLK